MIEKCASCNNQPEHDDMVTCKTKDCIEYGLQYNAWEWNNIPDIKELTTLTAKWVKEGLS